MTRPLASAGVRRQVWAAAALAIAAFGLASVPLPEAHADDPQLFSWDATARATDAVYRELSTRS